MKGSRLIPVGKIVKTHGLRGALKIFPYGETLGLQGPGAKLYAGSASGRRKLDLTLMHGRSQGRHYVVQFAEFSDIAAAQEVVEEELLVTEDRLPPTSEGEYYHYQLLGLQVVTVTGRELGILQGIIETGSNDVYVVAHATGEILIPALTEVIVEIDLQQGRMVIDPPEGLLDDL